MNIITSSFKICVHFVIAFPLDVTLNLKSAGLNVRQDFEKFKKGLYHYTQSDPCAKLEYKHI